MHAIGTRQRLLNAAIACIQEKGYAGTTARDISQRAQANLASIGYHFDGKDGLLDEALLLACERWVEPVIAAAASTRGSRRERIAALLEAFAVSLEPNRNTVIAFVEALARMRQAPALQASLAREYDDLRAAVANGLRGPAAGDREVDCTTLASAVIAICDGLMVQWLLDPDRAIDVAAIVDTIGFVDDADVRPPRKERTKP